MTDLYKALMKENEKEIEMKFTNGNGLDLTYNDVDFFGGPSEKMKTLLLNYASYFSIKVVNISSCYYTYSIVIYIM